MRPLRFTIPLLVVLILIAAQSAWAAVNFSWRTDDQAAYQRSEWTPEKLAEISPWHTEIAGRPALPLLPISLVIPMGERVASARLENVVTELIDLPGMLPPYEGMEDDHGFRAAVKGDLSGLLFPTQHIYGQATMHERGIASAEIALAPLLYERTQAGYRLHRLISCDVVIETEADFAANIPLRQNALDIARSRAAMARRVLNPEAVNAFAPGALSRSNSGPFEPRGLPSIEGSGVDLVIICDAAHASIFQDLADFKLSIGIPTVVRDLDWIRQNYPQGADLAETIRFFLQDAYVKWGITDLIIAGDTDVIPIRYILSHFKEPPEFAPTDAYYSCLDGNFNADGDRFFGESGHDGTVSDGVDFQVDINAGRLPVSNETDAQLMVDKIIAYTSTPDTTYTRQMTYLAEVLFPANYDTTMSDEEITRNGAEYAEEVRINYQVPLAPQIEIKQFFETWWLYPGSIPEYVEWILYDMDTRAHIVFHVGHGFRYTMSCGNESIVTTQALALTNGLDHLFNFYALNCTSCAVDFACLGEAYIRAPEGGSISSLGTSREAYPNTSRFYQNSHFTRLFSDSLSIGGIHSSAKNDWSPFASVEGSHRWTQYTYILIGDPTINVWMDTPWPLEVSLAEPYTFASDSLHVVVTIDAAPVDSALVVASKDGEDRALGYTDAAGLLSLPFYAETMGDIDITVISRNNLPYFGSVAIDAASGPRLSIGELAILDDPNADASVSGNADGRIDAGETVRLSLRVYNQGDTAASNLSLDVSLPNGELIPTASSYTGGETIAAADSLDLSGLFLIDAPTELVDGVSALIDFTIGFDAGATQVDQLDVDCHAPSPDLFTFVIDDSGGNNDGVPDDGETYTLSPEWKNYGSTPLGAGWQASLAAIDPNGTVNSGPVSLPDLSLLQRAETAGFSITESDVSAPNRFELTLTGPLGENLLDTLIVRRPSPPDSLILDSSAASTVIDLGWEIPPTDSVIAGYLIYRSLSDGGPYTRVNNEPTRHAYYRNEGLLESTTYFFVVESVDSSGYRSLISPSNSIATNPMMQNGWPIQTGGSSAGSLAIGDIDGDGDKEIVAPSKWLYAWHHDGIEVVDGDGNSGTYGVIGSEGEVFLGSVTLAQVDTSTAGLEIIATSQEPYAVHVFAADGTELPGWPKPMSYWLWATPAAADIDLDGTVEIFIAGLDGKFYAWHSDGTELIDGDNDPNTDGVFNTDIGGWSRSSAAIAQLDGDPELEITVGSRDAGKIFAWNMDGTDLPGFPVDYSPYPIHSSPAVGDIDNNGDMEIVFLCENDSLYVLQHYGLNYPGFPVKIRSNTAGLAPSPALCDFEDDGQLEIVIAGSVTYYQMYIYVLDNTGTPLPGWPVFIEDSTEGSPIVVDLDNDDELEILIGTESRLFYGFELDGTEMTGFPILTAGEVRSTPTIDDVDGDFDVEVALMGWDQNVYIWDLPAFYQNGMAQWKMFRANPARTGVFTREDQIIGVNDGPVESAEGKLFANFPNPFNPSTRIRFATPAGTGKVDSKLSVYDISGRLVKTLHEGELAGGTIHSYTWDGKNAAGNGVASGIYFSRLELDERVQSNKMLLLK